MKNDTMIPTSETAAKTLSKYYKSFTISIVAIRNLIITDVFVERISYTDALRRIKETYRVTVKYEFTKRSMLDRQKHVARGENLRRARE